MRSRTVSYCICYSATVLLGDVWQVCFPLWQSDWVKWNHSSSMVATKREHLQNDIISGLFFLHKVSHVWGDAFSLIIIIIKQVVLLYLLKVCKKYFTKIKLASFIVHSNQTGLHLFFTEIKLASFYSLLKVAFFYYLLKLNCPYLYFPGIKMAFFEITEIKLFFYLLKLNWPSFNHC